MTDNRYFLNWNALHVNVDRKHRYFFVQNVEDQDLKGVGAGHGFACNFMSENLMCKLLNVNWKWIEFCMWNITLFNEDGKF